MNIRSTFLVLIEVFLTKVYLIQAMHPCQKEEIQVFQVQTIPTMVQSLIQEVSLMNKEVRRLRNFGKGKELGRLRTRNLSDMNAGKT